MAFTANVTEFGHSFTDAVVEITEANLEYRLNSFGGPAPEGEDAPVATTRLRINYSIYVDQAAKDAGGAAMINNWDETDSADDIEEGNILAVAEAKITAKLAAPAE